MPLPNHGKQGKELTVPGTLKRIRQEMSVKPTPRGKGLTLTVRITVYDNGMIEVDSIPINEAPHYDPGHGWLGGSGDRARHHERVPPPSGKTEEQTNPHWLTACRGASASTVPIGRLRPAIALPERQMKVLESHVPPGFRLDPQLRLRPSWPRFGGPSPLSGSRLQEGIHRETWSTSRTGCSHG